MRYLLMFMMGAFGLCGTSLIWAGIRGIWSAIAHSADYEKATGTIVRLERKETHFSGRSMHNRSHYADYPVVEFKTASGEVVEFQSEVGDGSRPPRYRVGQPIGVLYDPYGNLAPILDSWFSLWGIHVAILVAGVVFLCGTGLIYVAFGSRIFGSE